MDKHNIAVEQRGVIIARIPLEDVSILLLSSPSATLTTPLISALAGSGVPIITVGPNYQPVGEFLPVLDHGEVGNRIRSQVAATLPMKKKLWKAIVEEKLKRQAQLLEFYQHKKESVQLKVYAKEVLSGDSTNREATGARVYWQALFGKEFRRDTEAPGINSLLNYSYAVIRAAVLRAIWAAGLLPYFGLNHSNRANAGVLADDLMEPFRPLADGFVMEAQLQKKLDLSPINKHFLSKLLWFDFSTSRGTSPFARALFYFTQSLVEALSGSKKGLEFPDWKWTGGQESCFSADTKSCG